MTSGNNEDYVTIKIPKALADEIDRVIESGLLGYRSRAELVSEAVRRRIEQLNSSNNANNHPKKGI